MIYLWGTRASRPYRSPPGMRLGSRGLRGAIDLVEAAISGVIMCPTISTLCCRWAARRRPSTHR